MALPQQMQVRPNRDGCSTAIAVARKEEEETEERLEERMERGAARSRRGEEDRLGVGRRWYQRSRREGRKRSRMEWVVLRD